MSSGQLVSASVLPVSDDPGKFSKLFSVLNEGERKQLTLRSKKQRFEAGDVRLALPSESTEV